MHSGHDHDHDHAHSHASAVQHGTHDGHGHAHTLPPGGFNRAFGLGIALNLGFVAIEAFYGWHVNSLALLADAGHNLSDVAGLVLAWVALLAGRLQPDARHTYGWRRASILAAFANAVILLVAMGSLAWEAAGRLRSPEVTQGLTIMAVAGVGILVNGVTALLFLRGSHGDLNIRGAFLHMAADALVSLAVVLGGALYLWQGWSWIDPVMSIGIAVVIVLGTLGLLRQSFHLLFDAVPENVDLAAVRSSLLALPGVADIHDLHVWALGTSATALTAHLVLHEAQSDVTALLHAGRDVLKEQFAIGHVTLQVEPPGFAPDCALHGGCHAAI